MEPRQADLMQLFLALPHGWTWVWGFISPSANVLGVCHSWITSTVFLLSSIAAWWEADSFLGGVRFNFWNWGNNENWVFFILILTNNSLCPHSSSSTTSMHCSEFFFLYWSYGERSYGELWEAGLEEMWLTPPEARSSHSNQSHHFTLPAFVHLPTFHMKLPSDLAMVDIQLPCRRSTTWAKNKDC